MVAWLASKHAAMIKQQQQLQCTSDIQGRMIVKCPGSCTGSRTYTGLRAWTR